MSPRADGGVPSPRLPPGFFLGKPHIESKEGKWNISFSGGLFVCLFVLLSSVVNCMISNFTSQVFLNHGLESSCTHTNAEVGKGVKRLTVCSMWSPFPRQGSSSMFTADDVTSSKSGLRALQMLEGSRAATLVGY